MNSITNHRQEVYRPQFHFTPEANWMNDPNGMVYYEGEYHLFFQYHPHSTKWGPMHWGHAVSEDLVYWEELPIALEPDELGMIFSGSAVVDWHDTTGFFNGESGLVAIFTHSDTHPDTKQVRQRQSIACSKDKGRTWHKYEANPVLENNELIDFRDPKVFWHRGTEKWVMVIAVGQCVHLYSSPDLINWIFESEFGKQDGSHDGVWECPDLFELPMEGTDKTKWVMLVSIGENPDIAFGSRTQYFIGEFDGKHFVNDHQPDVTLWLDYGRDNYAGVSFSDVQDGRRIYMGWMSNWHYANEVPTSTWRSSMTLPRIVSLQESSNGLQIKQEVVEEVDVLRTHHRLLQNETIDTEEIIPIKGTCMEIIAEFDIQSASEFGIQVRKSSQEETRIGYHVDEKNVILDRRHAGEASFHPWFASRETAPMEATNNRVKLHVYIDWSSVEVFGNDGEVAMTDLIFPSRESDQVGVYAKGGTVKLVSCTVYTLASIW
ncbi:glycoside hydrolase family 32 protein [Pontibacillus yanchengensis]|uniref:Glycoside hydrolase family 32 protein n=2 Tax=Pontibacillus yanchengensis TaxID=462910 RepID=A0ACC7VIP1_9BACI|nr:glycoside hydrolase family 32 protein [Pontibacillus yanchengensis]MYL34346.1 glycoside hydrolase family 32 protein [Pontibacillus yanchengensis]MYL53814.1 glycoside hydrolase family 32 protein [Pontibacillus yanchengensis]